MSQFMNGAKRLKGWKPVEKIIEEWLIIAEHEQAMNDPCESEEQFSSYSSSESLSSSPLTVNEPAVRNVYNQKQSESVQVTMHSHVVVPESRQELMYEAHPVPAFTSSAYTLPYEDYYVHSYLDDLTGSSDSWNYESAGFENYNSSPENFY